MNQWNKPPLGSQIDHEHPLSRGLVMALLMNEGSGNRIYDLSGNGNDGVLTNGPLWKPGRNGAAIAFDGISNSVLTSFNAFSGVLTFSIWFNALSIADGAILGSSNKLAFLLRLQAGGDIRLYPRWGWGGANVTHVISANRWYCLTIIFDEDSNTVSSYLDGALTISDISTVDYASGSCSLTIGGYPTIPKYFFGLISDTRIWNRALSPDEVQDLYINPYGFIYKPQKYWLMPQGVTIPPHLFRRVA